MPSPHRPVRLTPAKWYARPTAHGFPAGPQKALSNYVRARGRFSTEESHQRSLYGADIEILRHTPKAERESPAYRQLKAAAKNSIAGQLAMTAKEDEPFRRFLKSRTYIFVNSEAGVTGAESKGRFRRRRIETADILWMMNNL